jgi:hypothetical protein
MKKLLPIPAEIYDPVNNGGVCLANMTQKDQMDHLMEVIQYVNMKDEDQWVRAGIDPDTGYLLYIGLWSTEQDLDDQSEGKIAMYVSLRCSPDLDYDEVDGGGIQDDAFNLQCYPMTTQELESAANFVLGTCYLLPTLNHA